jgi:hypothetical protein
MILPGTYQNGFAPRDGEPLFPELWRGCVGAWNPGLGPTGLRLYDWSPYKNHGTLTNMDAGTDWVSSQGRYALDFDGTNDRVPLATRTSGTVTISCWVYARNINNANGEYYISRWGFNDIYVGSFANNWIARAGNGSSGGSLLAQSAATSNRWTHLAARRDASTLGLFVDGKLTSEVSAVGFQGVDSSPLNLCLLGVADFFANCQLDGIAIHNRDLLLSEIRLLASRRGIAYEMAPQGWTASQIAAYRARQYSQIIGGGVI